ncbi:unnamed protein product [Ectocarpus sp. 12 AP-2014]
MMFSTGGALFRSLWSFREHSSWVLSTNHSCEELSRWAKTKAPHATLCEFQMPIKRQAPPRLGRSGNTRNTIPADHAFLADLRERHDTLCIRKGHITAISERLPARDNTPAFLHHRHLPTSPVP